MAIEKLFDGENFFVRVAPNPVTPPAGELPDSYEIVNKFTNIVEFKSSQYAAALEVAIRFEGAMIQLPLEYEKLTRVIQTSVNPNVVSIIKKH